MNNNHEHNHKDHHDHMDVALAFEQKIVKLLEHWIKHNIDHAETYREWAEKANRHQLLKAGNFLNDAAEMTMQINEKFKNALKTVLQDR